MTRSYKILLIMIVIHSQSFGEAPNATIGFSTRKPKAEDGEGKWIEWNPPWKNEQNGFSGTKGQHKSELEEKIEIPSQIGRLKLEFRGDKDFLLSVASKEDTEKTVQEAFVEDLKNALEKDQLTEEAIEAIEEICAGYTKALIDDGYLLAYIKPETTALSDEQLTITVHGGSFGKVNFYEIKDDSRDFNDIAREIRDSATNREYPPFEGSFFSKDQILKRMTFREGDIFNYQQFYKDVLAITNHPDLTLNTLLDIRTVDGGSAFKKKVVDMDFFVKESLPLHGSITLDNTGTEETNEWRTGITFQYLNLTKNYDVLTGNFALALDGSLVSGAANYTIPIKNHSLTVSGGASDINVQDVIVSLDNEGDGWFSSGQYQWEAVNTSKLLLSFTAGLTHQSTKNQLLTQGTTLSDREISITPFNFGFSLANQENDGWGGRNSLSYTFQTNFESFLGSDDQAGFNDFRTKANADYNFSKLQISRIQRLPKPLDKGLVYFKLDGQYTDDRLVSIEQMAIGGMGTVRGYSEREFLGDKGLTASVEVRFGVVNFDAIFYDLI